MQCELCCVVNQQTVQAQRTSASTIQELRTAIDDAQAQLSAVQATADTRVDKAEAAATQQVEVFRQRWQQEFERRKQLHNQVHMCREG